LAEHTQHTLRGLAVHVLPPVLYAICIFVGGSLPQGPDTGLEFDHADKLLHLVAFGGFQLLTWRAVRYLYPARTPVWQLWCAVAASILAGALLEVWQSFLPTREAETLDLVADALGALLVAGALWLLVRAKGASPAE
jgi:VanZ family protein